MVDYTDKCPLRISGGTTCTQTAGIPYYQKFNVDFRENIENSARNCLG